MWTLFEQERAAQPTQDAQPASAELALFPILLNGKVGYINRTGQLVIAPQFTIEKTMNFRVLSAISVRGSSEGLIPVRTAGSWAYMDNNGTVGSEAIFDDAGSFSQGFAPVKMGGKWAISIGKPNSL
jgi:hypothetical protein